ncbi:MAG: hypothetical protein JW969_15305 [Spirochaetales bacterium]|nr:hypothetical protein [Spirochaetales bacterium]
MNFTDTSYIVAHRFLCEPERKWTTLDFPGCHRPAVVRLFNYLIGEGVLQRNEARGRNSHSLLVSPAKLLDLCIENFNTNEEKVLSFVSKRPEDDLLQDLLRLKVEFYMGRFTGIRRDLIYSTVSGFSLLLPDRSVFSGDDLAEFQLEFKLLKVNFGGNITLILPRFKEYLRKFAVEQEGIRLPSDFYTYLYLSNSDNPVALPQKEFIEKEIGGVNGNFLAWR